MNFGEALEALKANKMVARVGWNGKGMHIYLESGYTMPIGAGLYKGQKRTYGPALYMFTAQGMHQPGWLASQADMLAEDWRLVDGAAALPPLEAPHRKAASETNRRPRSK